MSRIKLISIALLLAILFVIPDMVMEVLHYLLEHLLELGHVLFEVVEVALDFLVEHVFHTDLHDTQIIVFYILFAVVLFWLRKLWRAFPSFYEHKRELMIAAKDEEMNQMRDAWQQKSWFSKLSWISIGGLLVIGAFFLLFM